MCKYKSIKEVDVERLIDLGVKMYDLMPLPSFSVDIAIFNHQIRKDDGKIQYPQYLRNTQGCYLFWTKLIEIKREAKENLCDNSINGKIPLYIGHASNIPQRLNAHLRGGSLTEYGQNQPWYKEFLDRDPFIIIDQHLYMFDFPVVDIWITDSKIKRIALEHKLLSFSTGRPHYNLR